MFSEHLVVQCCYQQQNISLELLVSEDFPHLADVFHHGFAHEHTAGESALFTGSVHFIAELSLDYLHCFCLEFCQAERHGESVHVKRHIEAFR